LCNCGSCPHDEEIKEQIDPEKLRPIQRRLLG
jgi:hypothetical protein